MPEPIRFANYFQVKPCDIQTKEFCAWRRVRGERRFKPYLIVEVAGCEILFDGYDNVWQFLDALFPNEKLPRNPVNYAMKGDNLFEFGEDNFIPFTRDIESFLHESEVDYLNIEVTYEGPTNHPIGDFALIGPQIEVFFATNISPHKKTRLFTDKKWGALRALKSYAYETLLPFADSNGERLVPTMVFGNASRLVFVQRVDSVDSKQYATFGVHSRPRYGDIRLERWTGHSNIRGIEKNVNRLLTNLENDEREYKEGEPETHALYSRERDIIECLRANSFCA